jgi:hypothetical protein
VSFRAFGYRSRIRLFVSMPALREGHSPSGSHFSVLPAKVLDALSALLSTADCRDAAAYANVSITVGTCTWRWTMRRWGSCLGRTRCPRPDYLRSGRYVLRWHLGRPAQAVAGIAALAPPCLATAMVEQTQRPPRCKLFRLVQGRATQRGDSVLHARGWWRACDCSGVGSLLRVP